MNVHCYICRAEERRLFPSIDAATLDKNARPATYKFVLADRTRFVCDDHCILAIIAGLKPEPLSDRRDEQ